MRSSSPVLSPNVGSASPSLFATLSIAFASGVPSAAFTCMLPLSAPPAWPARNIGTRLWLWTFESPIGDPYSTTVLSSTLPPSPSGVFFSFSSRYGTRLTWYLLIFAKSTMRSSFSWWCDAEWNAPLKPLSGYTRFDASRPSLKAKTRVRSDANATACKSNISFT